VSDVAVRELSEGEYPAWNALVRDSAQGSIYSLPEYLDALCSAVGGRFRVLGVYRGEELAGGVALYERRAWFGSCVEPRLLLYYNGPVLRDQDSKYPSKVTSRNVAVLGALEQHLRGLPLAGLMLKCRGSLADVRPFLSAGWRSYPTYTYEVPLTDIASQWGMVEQNLRRLVSRCTAEGMELTDDDDFEGFYRQHSETMRRKGTGPYLSARAFGAFVARLRAAGLCRLYHARLPSGESVAAQLVLLGHPRSTHTVTAASSGEHLATGASAFLRWRVFEALAELGFERNDLTDAALNPVTHFKSQFGGNLTLCLVVRMQATVRYRLGARTAAVEHRLRRLAARTLPANLRRVLSGSGQ
jgi:hypothetical protein